MSTSRLFDRALATTVGAALALTLLVASAQAQTYIDLHDFNSSAGDPSNFTNQGVMPQGHDGEIYGTSTDGGQFNQGTVFKISPTGTPTVLFSFDTLYGDYPICGLTTGSDGNFYAATAYDTTVGAGSIVQFTSAGAIEKLLYAFQNATDGSGPTCAPTQGTDGNYYGVTTGVFKGTQGTSTFYKITTTGTFTLLHTFAAAEGNHCSGITLGTDGNFYGACKLGGANSLGTLYKVSTAGKVTVLHSLTTSDGQNEQGAFLVQAKDGNFYGLGYNGGTDGLGVIFQLKPSGAYKVLHNFTGGTDGGLPSADLTLGPDGSLYGTAASGGTSSACSSGCGVIFKITTAGVFSVLYNFDGTHGGYPESNLTLHTDGLLYGDTASGGANGQGVFFSYNAGFKPFITISPVSGKVGTQVRIMGQGFDSASVVKFGGVAAKSITLTGTTYIVATVPAGAIDGAVTVTTGATTLTSAQQFTVHNSWSMGKAMPTARFGAFSGAIGTNVYVVGGATNSGYQATNVNEIYNTLTNTWKTGASDPTSRELGASAVVNGILYVIGGSTSGSNPLALVEAYNPASNTWTTKAPMPTARNSMAAVVDKDVIYVIGGYDPNTQVWYDTVESYNTTTDTWTEEAPLLLATSWQSVGLLGSTIVAADGNIAPSGASTGDSESYSVTGNTWTQVTADPSARQQSCFAAINGQLYVSGGVNAGAVLSVNEAYSSSTKKWTTLAPMPDALATPGSATVGGRLYCFGGASDNLSNIYNYVQIYQP